MPPGRFEIRVAAGYQLVTGRAAAAWTADEQAAVKEVPDVPVRAVLRTVVESRPTG